LLSIILFYAILGMHSADLSVPASIENAVASVPNGIDALCNIAGLPPTNDRALVLKIIFPGLRHLTELMIEKLNDNTSIVNVASLAGIGWPEAGDQSLAGYIDSHILNSLRYRSSAYSNTASSLAL